MMALSAALTAFVAGGCLAYYAAKKRHSGQSDGCNGHHWDDPKPKYVPATRRGYKMDAHISSEGSGSDNPAEMFVRAKSVKKCQDCHEEKEVNKTLARIPLEAVMRVAWEEGDHYDTLAHYPVYSDNDSDE